MIDFPVVLGAALGTMMGNPIILLAGLYVARNPVKRARFWGELIAAILICTAIQFSFDKGISDFPSERGLADWLMPVGLGTVMATLLFAMLRACRKLLRRPEQAE